jgi:hypothetical protein
MRDEGANASWFLLSLVLFFASPFYARSTAAWAARAVCSNPSVASNHSPESHSLLILLG